MLVGYLLRKCASARSCIFMRVFDDGLRILASPIGSYGQGIFKEDFHGVVLRVASRTYGLKNGQR